MELKIFAIGIILFMICTGLVSASSIDICDEKNDYDQSDENIITKSDNVIFRDDFDDFNTFWRVIQKFTSFDIHHGMAELALYKAPRFMYFNCELRSPNIFSYNTLKIRTQVNNSWCQLGKEDTIQKGTVGWGYWNHKFGIDEIEYAWFFHTKGSRFFPKNGLWAICKSPIKDNEYGGFSMIKIEGYDVTDWHEYEIDWNETYVDFYIDGENVAHVTKGVPQQTMTIDIWLDNAAWYGFQNGDIYFPIYQRVKQANLLFIDYVEVTD